VSDTLHIEHPIPLRKLLQAALWHMSTFIFQLVQTSYKLTVMKKSCSHRTSISSFTSDVYPVSPKMCSLWWRNFVVKPSNVRQFCNWKS